MDDSSDKEDAKFGSTYNTIEINNLNSDIDLKEKEVGGGLKLKKIDQKYNSS